MLRVLLAGGVVMAQAAFASAAGWSGPVEVASVTGSVKWTVRAVPDGAGGVLCAWEENRGRKVCCRDTRDLYAQRIDGSGRRVWTASDVPLAVLDAGEELLGVVASPSGGALALFRRGNGSLFVQELDGSGRSLLGKDGRVVDAHDELGDWLPGNGSAESGHGRSLLLCYGIPAEGGTSIRIVGASFGTTGWIVSAPVEIDKAMGLHPGTVAWCGTRWLVATWSEATDGIRVSGRWISADRSAISRPFDLGGERGRNYAFLQSVGDGAGGAWLLRAAGHSVGYSRTHTVTLSLISPKGADGAVVRHAVAGPARTSAMFIPPVMVGAVEQSTVLATPSSVSWRPTSWLVPTGPGRVMVLTNPGDRLVGVLARARAGKLAMSPATTIADGLADAFTTVAWSRSGGVGVVWGRSTPTGVRLESATIRSGTGGPVPGPVMVLADARSPRMGVAVASPDGGVTLVYTESLGSDSGAVRAVSVSGEFR